MAKKKKKPHHHAPKDQQQRPALSQSYLELAWSRREFPAPPSLSEALENFNETAEGFIQTPARLPGRLEVSHLIAEPLRAFFNDKWINELGLWLLEPCTSEAQKNKIQDSLEALIAQPWALENPIMRFLMGHWGEDLYPDWAPFWCSLFEVDRWPEPTLSYWSALREQFPDDPCEEGLDELPLERYLDWWRYTSRLMTWAKAPGDYFERLTDAALDHWLQLHPDMPGPHRLGQVVGLLQANSILEDQLNHEGLRDFLLHPEADDWLAAFRAQD